MPLGRTYFALGEILVPNGGAHVIFDIVNRLNEAGYDAGMLYARPNYFYPFAEMPKLGGWSPRLTGLRSMMRGPRLIAKSRRTLQCFGDRMAIKPMWPEVEPAADDIIVSPEYRYPEVVSQFPEQTNVVLVQGNYAVLHAFSRDHRTKLDAFSRVDAMLATSKACMEVAELLSPPFLGELSLDLDKELFGYLGDKKFQVAYTPRRRPEEAGMLEALMGRFLPDVPMVSVHGVSREEAARMIRESLFFISLSEKEGFGLPAAEAIATGAIVTGYTGLGGDEFFTNETGFPVTDSDVVGVMKSLQKLISDYRADPTALDKKRQDASKKILETYNKEVATSQLIATWTSLETHLQQVTT